MALSGLCKGLMLLTFILFGLLIRTSQAYVQDRRYIGCYKEDKVYAHGKRWRDLTKNVASRMTIDLCAMACAKQKYLLAGLMNGNECWCSRSSVYGLSPCPVCCQKQCEGDQSLKCGGWRTLDIYEAVADKRYFGCYDDKQHGSSVYSTKLSTHNFTIDNCIRLCGRLNFRLAGIESTQDCTCSNNGYKQFGRCINRVDCKCDFECLFDRTEKCGGASAMSVYRTECRDSGKWGGSCDKECYCRYNIACQMANGRCSKDECAAGWYGPSCSKECNYGTYGFDCAYNCSCGQNTDCNKATGVCYIDLITGIVSGVVALLLLIIAIWTISIRCRKRKMQEECETLKLEMDIYSNGKIRQERMRSQHEMDQNTSEEILTEITPRETDDCELYDNAMSVREEQIYVNC